MSDTRRGFFGRLVGTALAAKAAAAVPAADISDAGRLGVYDADPGDDGTAVYCPGCGAFMYVHHAGAGDLGCGSAPALAYCYNCMRVAFRRT